MKRDVGFEDRLGGLLALCLIITIALAALALASLIKMCATHWR